MAIVSWLPAYSDSCAPARLVSRTAKRTRDGLGDSVVDTFAVRTGLVRTPAGSVEQAVRRSTHSPNWKRVTARSTHGWPGWFRGRAGWRFLAAGRPGGAGKVLGDAAELPAAAGFYPVRQDHLRHLVDLDDPHLGDPSVGGQRLRRLAPNEIGAVPVHLEADVELSEGAQDPGRHDDLGKANDRFGDPCADLGILLSEAPTESGWIRLPFFATLHDLDA